MVKRKPEMSMQDYSETLSEFVKLKKKDKRLENKKKKAEALLCLINQRREAKRSKRSLTGSSTPCKTDGDNLNNDVASAKKCKVETSETDSPVAMATEADIESSRAQCPSKKEKHQLKKQKLKEIRTKIKQIQKEESKERPKLHLTLKELFDQQNKNTPQKEVDELPPLFMLDLQHLVTLALLPDSYEYYPRWCKLVRPRKVTSVVVIVIDKLSSEDLEEYQDCFPFMKKNFHLFAEIISPYQYGSSVMKDLFRVPLSVRRLKRTSAPSIKSVSPSDDKTKLAKPESPSVLSMAMSTVDRSQMKKQGFGRKQLLLNPLQMIHENYPMPIVTLKDKYVNFKFSYDSYERVTKKSPMFAIDCEMCMTTRQVLELTRVSVVNEKLETVYDTLVKPYNKIIQYLTQYSGITKEMLVPVKTRLQDVQKKFRELMPSDSIWIGQSFNNDLLALKLFHPYVIDTSVIYNLSGLKWKKTGLKVLTAQFLNQDIQTGSDGHSPVEDAKAAMELVLLKLSRGMYFGDATLLPSQSENEEMDAEMDEAQEESKCASPPEENNSTGKKEIEGTISEPSSPASDADKEPEETLSDTIADTDSVSNTKPDELVSTESSNTSSVISGAINKRQLFFNQAKACYHGFFAMVKKGDKSAVLIDKEENLLSYASTPGIKCLARTSDTTRTEAAATAVVSRDFVWVQLHALNNQEQLAGNGGGATGSQRVAGSGDEEDLEDGEIEDSNTKKCMKRLDKRVKKIMAKVRSKSLVCVVLSGQSQDTVRSGGVLLKLV